jgi:phosphoribosyl 1,2-cyclic phosphodiesterase
MKLLFLGTRGNIEARTPQHFRHTVLSVGHQGRRVIIDCGGDWLMESRHWDADAIVITHAHPDHVDGLKRGAPCPVFATRETWKIIGRFPIEQRFIVRPRRPMRIGGITIEAFGVEHSLRAPAVGYRITAGDVAIFYCPDLVYIHRRQAALMAIAAYIGDGATISRPFVRRRGRRLIGHAPVGTQLAWCQTAGVPRAMITHCGTQIVTADRTTLKTQVAALSRKYKLRVQVADDGMEIVLRRRTVGA